MTTTFVTSDWHIGHSGILKRQPERARLWGDVESAASSFVSLWNSTVSKRDTVWALGDLFWSNKWFWRTFPEMNGRINVVLGNHDDCLSSEALKMFESVSSYREVRLGLGAGRTVLCHYPFKSWRNSWHGSVSLHGHSHNHIPVTEEPGRDESFWRRRVDVGIDAWDLRPASVDEITTVVRG
jgi:calcineurin-like phosphoesterase family protein